MDDHKRTRRLGSEVTAMRNETNDEFWMAEALKLAENGVGFVSPNPAVGAVIVRDGAAVGKGWHAACGGPHAEIEAIRSLPDPALAEGADLYVTLEPCSSWGRTPPCCDAILQHGFRRVVVGCVDPNPKHAGRGLELLTRNGIETKVGVLEEECRLLNEPFFHWITTKRPFVLLKMAQTLDGRIATESGDAKWISSETAREHVQELRLASDAILCGMETYRLDRPRLTARAKDGSVLKTPRRIVAAHRRPDDLPADWECVSLDSREEWDAFLQRLGSENVLMLLLEGGGELAASALHAEAVSKIEFHIAPILLGGRGSRPSVGGPNPLRLCDAAARLRGLRIVPLGEDFAATAYPDWNCKGGV